MDQGTQQNAAMVEESTAASNSLAHEAENLFSMISRFKVSEAQSHRFQTPTAFETISGPSPARKLIGKVTAAFKGNTAVAGSWEEF